MLCSSFSMSGGRSFVMIFQRISKSTESYPWISLFRRPTISIQGTSGFSRFTHYLEKSHKRKVELTVSINISPASAPNHGNCLAGMVEHMPKPDMVSMRPHIPSPIQQ
jgi:hypothetical protein